MCVFLLLVAGELPIKPDSTSAAIAAVERSAARSSAATAARDNTHGPVRAVATSTAIAATSRSHTARVARRCSVGPDCRPARTGTATAAEGRVSSTAIAAAEFELTNTRARAATGARCWSTATAATLRHRERSFKRCVFASVARIIAASAITASAASTDNVVERVAIRTGERDPRVSTAATAATGTR